MKPAVKPLIRIVCAAALMLVVTACDKCGNFNLNLPNFSGTPKACSPSSPQG